MATEKMTMQEAITLTDAEIDALPCPELNTGCISIRDCAGCADCMYCNDCYSCDDCVNCQFCLDCHDCCMCYSCNSCIDCAGLHHAQYCIRNMQFTMERYHKLAHFLKG